MPMDNGRRERERERERDATHMVIWPTLEHQKRKGDKTYVEAPGCGGPWASFSSGAMEAHPTLDKAHVEAPGCGGPWASFSSGAVEAHPTLEHQK